MSKDVQHAMVRASLWVIIDWLKADFCDRRLGLQLEEVLMVGWYFQILYSAANLADGRSSHHASTFSTLHYDYHA